MLADETIEAWRREIAAEVAELKEQIVMAEGDVEGAAVTASTTAEAHRKIANAVEVLGHRPVATAVAQRVAGHGEEARRAGVRLAAARQAVKGLRLRLADLALALEQLAAISAAASAECEAELAEAA